MSLRLTIENVASLTSGDPVVKALDGHGLVIGRAGHVDWTLPDPQALISSVHCEVDYRDGSYWLTDRSTNGTYVNGAPDRLAAPWQLQDGDLVSIGHYAVRVALDTGVQPGSAGGGAVPTGASLWGRYDEQPDRSAATDAFGRPGRSAIFSSGDRPVEDGFRPPEAVATAVDMFGLGVPPVPAGFAPPAPPAPAAGPAGSDIFGLGGSAATPAPSAWGPAVTPVPAPPVAANPASIWGTLTAQAPVDFTPPAPAMIAAEPVPAVTAAPAPAGNDGALFARFLAGAGLRPRDVDDVPPESVLAAAGELLRQTADGLIQLLYARARLRNQFGVGAEVTTFQRDGNNPLKWTRSAEEALRQIVGKPDRGFLPGPLAVRGAFEDLQAHELALMAAMQEALKDTIQRFSPAAIRARPGRTGLLSRLLPQARDAALWQAYEAEFRAMADETEAAYLDVFAKNFKKAYARNLARVDQRDT
ncbi:type VI secretion system-associated FHA domain protein TagH [Polymorphobacter fuscus]|uniref:type VI secretion system-associated FHA domain protein TagH n=1 Tax=Sandarakinorhabdus fusca TaxID=1439888 RepID=UPI0012981709|nr:type VI secretion system-associated FHA domain protein TagH [Polymorphobacter fuscus]NJC07950.1 type VI secretion system FHA domain protein [Polymorphobacter fuscus]